MRARGLLSGSFTVDCAVAWCRLPFLLFCLWSSIVGSEVRVWRGVCVRVHVQRSVVLVNGVRVLCVVLMCVRVVGLCTTAGAAPSLSWGVRGENTWGKATFFWWPPSVWGNLGCALFVVCVRCFSTAYARLELCVFRKREGLLFFSSVVCRVVFSRM